MSGSVDEHKRKRLDVSDCSVAHTAFGRVAARRQSYRVPTARAMSMTQSAPHTAEHVYDAAVVHGLVHVRTADELLLLWNERQRLGVPFIVIDIGQE